MRVKECVLNSLQWSAQADWTSAGLIMCCLGELMASLFWGLSERRGARLSWDFDLRYLVVLFGREFFADGLQSALFYARD